VTRVSLRQRGAQSPLVYFQRHGQMLDGCLEGQRRRACSSGRGAGRGRPPQEAAHALDAQPPGGQQLPVEVDPDDVECDAGCGNVRVCANETARILERQWQRDGQSASFPGKRGDFPRGLDFLGAYINGDDSTVQRLS